MHRSRVAFFVVLGWGLITIGSSHAGVLPREADGYVRFYNVANSAFDQYSSRPSSNDRAWMREHYARMQTYSPYFDKRLSWYPNAWVYKDSYAIKPNWPVYRQHPEWVLKDAAGNQLYIQWGCRSGTCPQYAADVGNPDFRANWIKEARAQLAKGYKGIFVDDVNLAWRISNGDAQRVEPINPRTGAPMTLDEWQADFATFMEEVRAALPNAEIVHNSIWYADEFTNPAVLREIDAADYINLERAANDQGLTGGTGRTSFTRFLSFIDLVHARGKGVIMMDYNGGANLVPGGGAAVDKSLQAREFGLAGWFLISSGIDLMSTNQNGWIAPGHFWRGYGLDLGKSLGPRYRQQGVLRRDFECGYVLLNPPGGASVRIAVASEDRRLDGASGGAVDLAARSAAIIEHACAKSTEP